MIGGYTPDFDVTCYVLTSKADTWDTLESGGECASLASKGAYGLSRVAPFPTSSKYTSIVNALVPASTPTNIWLGARGSSPGTALVDYCWMTDQSTPGSQVSASTYPVTTVGTTGSSWCLFVNTGDLFNFMAADCKTGTYQAICEMSKRSGKVGIPSKYWKSYRLLAWAVDTMSPATCGQNSGAGYPPCEICPSAAACTPTTSGPSMSSEFL